MCRALIYLGRQPALLYDLLYGPDNSLVHQTYAPKLLKRIQNLAGLGFCAWSYQSTHAELPFYYRTTQLPFFDKNLFSLSQKIEINCVLAHIRGVTYSTEETISEQNVHPFKYKNCDLAFAHNGDLAQLTLMKQVLKDLIKPAIFTEMKGTTDTEWIYALFLSQLDDHTKKISLEKAWDALLATFQLLKEARKHCNITGASPLNIFLINQDYFIVTRFVYGFGSNDSIFHKEYMRHSSLWITVGRYYGEFEGSYLMQGSTPRNNILVASEPLNKDRTSWIELPEYSITKGFIEKEEVTFRTYDLIV